MTVVLVRVDRELVREAAAEEDRVGEKGSRSKRVPVRQEQLCGRRVRVSHGERERSEREEKDEDAPLLRLRAHDPLPPLAHLAHPPPEEEPDAAALGGDVPLGGDHLVDDLARRELAHRDALLRREPDAEDGPLARERGVGVGGGKVLGGGRVRAQVGLGAYGRRVGRDGRVEEGEEVPGGSEAGRRGPSVRFAADAARVEEGGVSTMLDEKERT